MPRPNRPGPGRGAARPKKPDGPSGPPGAPRLILGQNPVREAIAVHGSQLGFVLIEHDPNPRLAALGRFAADHGVRVESAPRGELDRIGGSGRHQGVLAWAPELELIAPEALLDDPELLALALDGVVDPQNFGAVIRSAVGIARAPVVFGENASAPLTPATFRASAGAVEHARLCRVRSLPAFLVDARARGATIVGLVPDGDLALENVPMSGPTVLVIGSEEAGLQRATRKACTHFARLTSSGAVQSLNASVAAGVALYLAAMARRS